MSLRPVSWIRQALRRGLAAALPRRVYITHGPPRPGAVCLTFDDGPHPDLTPPLLDLLARLGVPATFFVVGQEAEKYPDLIRRMAAEGHAVGNHSYSHPPRVTLTRRAAAAEVSEGAAAIGRILGRPPTLYRPPHGKVTAGDLWRLWRTGTTTVLWNADPKDYAKATAAEVRQWFRDRPPAPGDLILLHDVCTHALEVLPEVVGEARGRGLEFRTVSEWTA
ncbi:MAG TPA: polysaccharide deacetylase family protein [Urbifossiella sp.]|jgi:peptidoglycan/xylan/chitin deacetylase (PgdA/CDA1 family)|nr:polysaccharide deacetylase family protein [Urbifossiella sp.]